MTKSMMKIQHAPYCSIKRELLMQLAKKERCLIKHFCGTGKTHIVFHLMHKLVAGGCAVIVFPSIALITQFNKDYMARSNFKWLSVCSVEERTSYARHAKLDKGITTDASVVCRFVARKNKKHSKVLSSTYHSLDVVLKGILDSGKTIELLVYDEAHHITEERVQSAMIPDRLEGRVKQTIFLTATPRNKNGIIMDPETPLDEKVGHALDKETYEMLEANDRLPEGAAAYEDPEHAGQEGFCGPIVDEFTHLQAVDAKDMDGNQICNDFEVAADFYGGDGKDNLSVYHAIARTVLSTGNGRVLSFHSDVKNSVESFVDQMKFRAAFRHVLEEEFPEKQIMYTTGLDEIKIEGIKRGYEEPAGRPG